MSPILMVLADRSLGFTVTVVTAGISIVLGILVLLIFVFNLFGKAVSTAEKRAKAKKQNKKSRGNLPNQANIPIKAPTAPTPVVEQGISEEVVAAITAAIVAYEGTGVTIKSIKRKPQSGRNPWAQAAVLDNTRPF